LLLVLEEFSTFLYQVFDEVLSGGEGALAISLPLFLVAACDLADVVCLGIGNGNSA
ncbi:hypothetical protein Tco_1118672, partial [Tanacetum coccineum]